MNDAVCKFRQYEKAFAILINKYFLHSSYEEQITRMKKRAAMPEARDAAVG